MQTELLRADEPGAVEQAADLLIRGHLVAFPTDTLYGVGAILSDSAAIQRLYQVKGRPLNKGIPILLADRDDVHSVVRQVPDLAWPLMANYWPGPLTLILPKHPDLPAVISPNEGVALRIPDSQIGRRLIRAAGGAVATSSANRSGEPPACTAGEVLEALGGRIAAILDGGPVALGQASTVLDCTATPPSLLRQGPIPAQALLAASANST